MKPVQFRNVAFFSTSLFLLSGCSVDSESDPDQSPPTEQIPVTGSENDPNSAEQPPKTGESNAPTQPPASSPVQAPEPTSEPEPALEPAPEPEPARETSTGSHYQPPVLVTWQLQLQGTPNTSYDAELYVMDLFDTPASKIASLQSRGISVICYFSAGTFEEWRSDANKFDASDLGDDLDDWPGERWLDVRSQNVRNIMKTRLNLARTKGCDGVDPDNVDGYSNRTGINLTSSDQLSYNGFLSNQAHSRGLAIGLKNNVGQVENLVDDYDFTINESCDRYNECDRLNVFIIQGKPVLHVEYRPELLEKPIAFSAYCQEFMDKQFSSLVLPRDLDDEYRLSCQ